MPKFIDEIGWFYMVEDIFDNFKEYYRNLASMPGSLFQDLECPSKQDLIEVFLEQQSLLVALDGEPGFVFNFKQRFPRFDKLMNE